MSFVPTATEYANAHREPDTIVSLPSYAAERERNAATRTKPSADYYKARLLRDRDDVVELIECVGQFGPIVRQIISNQVPGIREAKDAAAMFEAMNEEVTRLRGLLIKLLVPIESAESSVKYANSVE